MRTLIVAALAAVSWADFASDFDCAARNLALEYAYNLQPERPASFFEQLADAFNGTPEKPSNCSVAVPLAVAAKARDNKRFQTVSMSELRARERDGATYYVDAVAGNDANPGTESQPFKTIWAALNATRTGENPTWTHYANLSAVWDAVGYCGNSGTGVPFLGYTDNETACLQLCANYSACTIYTWHDQTQVDWQRCCYGRTDGIFDLTPEAGHWTGQLTPAPKDRHNTIVLRAGTHYPGQTVVLDAMDSGLQFIAYPGEEVWISGATPINGVIWQAYNVSNGPAVWQLFPNMNAVTGGPATPGQGAPGIPFLGYTDDEPTCRQACNNTPSCTVYTWHDQNQGEWAKCCYGRTDGQFPIQPESGHYSGHLQAPPNVWSVSLASMASTLPNGVMGLRSNGVRLQRARYPNWNSEISFGPSFMAGWTPQQTPRVPDVQIDLPSPVRDTTISMFKTFTAGIGGTCDRFEPPAGYWCSVNVQGGGSVVYFVPIAMNVTQAQLPHTPYANPRGGVIMTWRPGHWASWMAEIGDWTYDSSSGATNFSIARGLFQGSRGENQGDEVYVENIFEELDAPGEWFFNETTAMMYYWNNVSVTPGQNPPPPANDGSIAAVSLKHLFNISGDMYNPVTGVSFIGIGFRDTAYTYMDPHSIPSGGDWTLERSAVLLAEGTEGLKVSGCVFERVDGNAILLSAYTRNASITHNEFAWLGASAIAAWGNTYGGDDRLPPGYGLDGSQGDQPRGVDVSFNYAHEIGIWQKQSSFYTQFKSSENWIHGNVVMNGPRAHINFNDGFRGGSVIENNLLFNSCRESADHGPFNSWDRDPYTFDLPGLAPPLTSMVKMPDTIRSNFVFANYYSLSSVDNDDGSNYYNITNNVQLYGNGGLKNDFEGHDGHATGNLFAFVQYGASNGYSDVIGTPGQAPYMLPGHVDSFVNNTVYQTQDNDWGYAHIICNGTAATVLGSNTVFTPSGNISECGMPIAQWQAAGNDQNTVVMPASQANADSMIALARTILGQSLESFRTPSPLWRKY